MIILGKHLSKSILALALGETSRSPAACSLLLTDLLSSCSSYFFHLLTNHFYILSKHLIFCTASLWQGEQIGWFNIHFVSIHFEATVVKTFLPLHLSICLLHGKKFSRCIFFSKGFVRQRKPNEANWNLGRVCVHLQGDTWAWQNKNLCVPFLWCRQLIIFVPWTSHSFLSSSPLPPNTEGRALHSILYVHQKVSKKMLQEGWSGSFDTIHTAHGESSFEFCRLFSRSCGLYKTGQHM